MRMNKADTNANFVINGRVRFHRLFLYSSRIIDDECVSFIFSSFILSQQLSTHVKQVHERRYDQVCHICAKVYNSKQSMIDHLKKHSNIKEPEVSCSYCGKSYSTKRLMETHVRRTHKEDGKVYECPECHKLFERKTLLDFHIVYHHSPEPHKCSICDREFKIAKYLKVSDSDPDHHHWSSVRQNTKLMKMSYILGTHGNTYGYRFVHMRLLPKNV